MFGYCSLDRVGWGVPAKRFRGHDVTPTLNARSFHDKVTIRSDKIKVIVGAVDEARTGLRLAIGDLMQALCRRLFLQYRFGALQIFRSGSGNRMMFMLDYPATVKLA
jgi:hypothetical protein